MELALSRLKQLFKMQFGISATIGKPYELAQSFARNHSEALF
jgi:superfamily II helicase